MLYLLLRIWSALSAPLSVLVILNSKRIHKAYDMTLFKKLKLGLTMLLNSRRIQTGTAYRSQLALALKILETPPEVKGDVVECGTFKGGTAANLSLVCKIVNRRLIICDSFEGLPPGKEGDREAKSYNIGDFCGPLEEVRRNISRYGALECCDFIKGWFDDTLPHFESPVILAYVDVDLEDSLATCVRYLWPNLVERGYIFIDECMMTDYCALFYSEKWWSKYFQRTPPGMVGVGTGLPLGGFYIGPWEERQNYPLQAVSTGAYTRKDMSGYWAYYRE